MVTICPEILVRVGSAWVNLACLLVVHFARPGKGLPALLNHLSVESCWGVPQDAGISAPLTHHQAFNPSTNTQVTEQLCPAFQQLSRNLSINLINGFNYYVYTVCFYFDFSLLWYIILTLHSLHGLEISHNDSSKQFFLNHKSCKCVGKYKIVLKIYLFYNKI